ncbi:Hemicentin-1, partial [Schistosoma japonicum]
TGLLTITDAKKEDSGRYVCKAINKINEDSKSVMIEIIERPTIHTSMKPILARENEQILLPCRTSGTQPIRIQWLLPSGQLITADQPGVFRLLPEQGLLIEKVRSEHAGRYRCSANNEAGFQNAVVSLEVLIPPTLVKPANLEVSGRLNSVLRLNCEVESGSPIPTLTWERDGLTFSRTKSYYTTTESGLFIFNSLKPEDEGELTCIAKNAAGEDRITFRVFVQVPPRVSLPISTIGYEGKSVTMNCEADGRPKPEIIWEFKGQPMTSHLGDRVRFETPTKVTIHDLNPSDGGTYSCIARSPGQEMAMDSTFLTIFTKPEFERTPNQTTEAYEARWIQFRCIANGHPKPEIRWMHNGNIIPSNPSKNGVGSLVLGPLRTDQAGRYTCVAKNDAGNVEYDFELKVKTRPKVHVYQSDEPPRESDTTRLRCEVSGDADSVVWLKDGNIISNSSRFRILDKGSSLVIKMAKAKDTGTYQCIAANPVGEDLGELRLVVESKPYLINHPNNMTAQIGSVVVMECLAEGQPKPTITWYKDKQQIILRGHRSLVNNGSLRIVGVSSDDDGLYHCVASSSLGEDFSPPAFLQVQLDGRWSDWSSWSECSQTCGHGTQSRIRTCTNPAPKYGGAHCFGENTEIRPCLVKFCPTDGEWGSWTPWSACTATCGAGLSQRRRRCDSPPPSNGGRSCVGEAVEDVMCEGLPPCPVSGSWSPWSPWSDCSSTCGTVGTQNRKRTCDNPTPSNGGRSCPGQELMVRACNRGPCPVNGGWGTWSPWSHCSHSCGGGQRRRTRICDSPVPAYGGDDCPPTGSTETSECQSEPCPIHGDWSNWSSWSACSRTCGVGLQTRERECTQPQPQFGGRLCRGLAKEIRTCEMQKRGSSEFCPDNEPGLSSTWSEWSSWSECEPDCSSNGQISETNGIKRRERTCTLLSPENELTNGCPGPAEEIQDCTLEFKSDRCQNLLRSFSRGLLTGTIQGQLNNHDIGTIHLNANWSNTGYNSSTNYAFYLTNVPIEYSQCLQALTEIYLPGIWYAAKEISGASNGHTVMGRLNGITWESIGQFADGNTVHMSQRVLRLNESNLLSLSESVVHLTTNIYLSGSCTVSLIDSKTIVNPDIELHNFHENLVQLNPHKGSLHSHSSRAFTVYNLEREKSQMEPYSWISTIHIGPDRRQTYLTQELHVNELENKADLHAGRIEFYAESIIKKPIGPEVCPAGFEINQARVTGASMRLQRRRDYCKDVDECAFPNLNKCDHVCKNTIPHYTCTCHKGYRLSTDGYSCIDIDECNINGNNVTICPYGQRCINTHGGYECKQVCGPGLKENPTTDRCEDINECQNEQDLCGVHTCVNTFGGYHCVCLPGYKRIGEICQDIDECLSGTYQCSENERCVNIPGSFRCHPACPQGYRAVGTQESNIVECIDIDECAIGSHQCPIGAKCINEPGAYSCRCLNGQEAGSQGCDNRRDLLCNEGFQWNREKGCIDIDECNPTFGSSPCQYKCLNTYGAYRCECPIGYEIERKTNLCRDINECNIGNPCRPDEVCLNLPGNYTCVQQRCPKNYIFDKKSKSCRIKCSDSKLNCPHGAMFADTVEYLIVSLPSPESFRVTGSRIMLRVVDWHQVQQSNCYYQLLDKAPNTPVQHRTEDGVVYLTPNWSRNNQLNQSRERTLLSAHIEAATNRTYQQLKHDEFGQLYYLFFRVSCYENDSTLSSSSLPSITEEGLQTPISSTPMIDNEYTLGNQTWSINTSWDINNHNQSNNKYKLVFQHSFYVYISISKYPF